MNIINASEKWNITPRRIATLCNNGRIEGAIKEKGVWLIPINALKPLDGRVKSGKYLIKEKTKLPLPTGISDYIVASSEYYYIDKTLLIKELLDEKQMVSLFTRPRRFGKTLTMNMLKTFFEKANNNTSIYFVNKKIWKCGKKYQEYQGKYPVIFINFKDIKHTNWNDAFIAIKKVIIEEIQRHIELLNSDSLSDYDKKTYNKLCAGDGNEIDYEMSLKTLSLLLNKHYKEKCVIIIDEYDTPISEGYVNSFYDETIRFMRNFFSAGFKDNNNLAFGFLTGILRVAKESVFSGLNNISINSVLESKYSEYFGFTIDEIKEMTKYYKIENKYSEICDWYDGYNFGSHEIFNPWSVINYFRNNYEPRPYWQSTGSNSVIGELLNNVNDEIYEKLNDLLQGRTISSYIDTSIIYPNIKDDPSTLFSFLLVAGYLKIESTTITFNGDFYSTLCLPNKEIHYVYNKEILKKLNKVISDSVSVSIYESLYKNDTTKLQNTIGKLLKESVSYYDTTVEKFYHGLVLGLCASLSEKYFIYSNRESGSGRYDIMLEPKTYSLPGIIIEIKYSNNLKENELENLAIKALKQIDNKEYNVLLTDKNIKTIYKYGMAFSNKNVIVKSEIQQL